MASMMSSQLNENLRLVDKAFELIYKNLVNELENS